MPMLTCQTTVCDSVISGGAVDDTLARQRGWVIAEGVTKGGKAYRTVLCPECMGVPF